MNLLCYTNDIKTSMIDGSLKNSFSIHVSLVFIK